MSTSSVKASFVKRLPPPQSPNLQSNVIGLLNTFVDIHPNNVINTDSLIYQLAVKQYNSQLQLINPTLERPPVPKWFCGFISGPGQLRSTPKQGDVNILPTNSLPPAQPNVPLNTSVTTIGQSRSITITTTQTTSGYPADSCLVFGVPGSTQYTYCQQGSATGLDAIEMMGSGIDWNKAFEVSSPSFDSAVEDARAQVAAELEAEQAATQGGTSLSIFGIPVLNVDIALGSITGGLGGAIGAVTSFPDQVFNAAGEILGGDFLGDTFSDIPGVGGDIISGAEDVISDIGDAFGF